MQKELNAINALQLQTSQLPKAQELLNKTNEIRQLLRKKQQQSKGVAVKQISLQKDQLLKSEIPESPAASAVMKLPIKNIKQVSSTSLNSERGSKPGRIVIPRSQIQAPNDQIVKQTLKVKRNPLNEETKEEQIDTTGKGELEHTLDGVRTEQHPEFTRVNREDMIYLDLPQDGFRDPYL